MGYYTKVVLDLPIKKDIDENTKQILYHIFDGDTIENLRENGLTIPQHKFFKTCSRIWFPRSAGSYYFTATNNSNIKYDTLGTYAMVLYINSDSKIDYEDVDNFLDWIYPYIAFEYIQFLGYSLYEEDKNPTLYWYTENGIIKRVCNI